MLQPPADPNRVLSRSGSSDRLLRRSVRSSLHAPRAPTAAGLAWRATVRMFSLPSFAVLVAVSALHLGRSTATMQMVVVGENTAYDCVSVLNMVLAVHVFAQSAVCELMAFEESLRSKSLLEDRLHQWLKQRFFGSDQQWWGGRVVGCHWHPADMWMVVHIAVVLGMRRSATITVGMSLLMRICALTRLAGACWELMVMISETWLLETQWGLKNNVTVEQVQLAVGYLQPLAQTATVALVVSDFASSTLGFETDAIWYSFIVSAGVMGVSSREILVDFVASVHLMYDKPFSTGDGIQLGGGELMTVKKISYKYTRLESIEGPAVILPNRMVANARIHNWGQCTRRRLFTNWHFDRSMTTAQVAQVPDVTREVLMSFNHISPSPHPADDSDEDGDHDPERPGLDGGSVSVVCMWMQEVEMWSYHFELGYVLVDVPDFRKAKMAINVALMERFDAEGWKLATCPPYMPKRPSS